MAAKALLLIDLECTCNDSPSLPREEVEVIEIGAVVGSLLDSGFTAIGQWQSYVKPCVHTELSPFCVKLTGITQAQVNQAPILSNALQAFDAWLAGYSFDAWGSWGKFDANQLHLETCQNKIRNPLAALPHINIKQLFARKTGHRVGLARATQLLGLNFIGQHHSGLDDARNIAQILSQATTVRHAVLKKIASDYHS
jgi:inhibitor of KinA sporulation pathway (predicted exonuclease)